MSHPNDETMWTEEQLDAVWNEVALGEVCSSSALCAALLDARVRADKAEALVAVLKAECRAAKALIGALQDDTSHRGLIDAGSAYGAARAATDAALGGEAL